MNRSLYPTDWSPWLTPVVFGGLGWLTHRATEWPDAIVSIVVGGFVLWFFLGSKISFRLYRETPRAFSIAWVAIAIAAAAFTIDPVLPLLFAIV